MRRMMVVFGFVAAFVCGGVVEAAAVIEAEAAFCSSRHGGAGGRADNAVDPTDLNDSGRHISSGWGNGTCWLSSSAGEPNDQWIYVDLGGAYDLEEIRIWNYHESTGGGPEVSGRSVRQFGLWVAGPGAKLPDGPGARPFKDAGWRQADVGASELGKGPATKGNPGDIEATDVFSLAGQDGVRYVGIDVGSGYGGQKDLPNSVGLAQIQVTGSSLQAGDPDPWDGCGMVDAGRRLSWEAPQAYAASGYRVYFGRDRKSVEAGESSALAGEGAATRFKPGEAMASDAEYFWRVDAMEGQVVHEGRTWSFRTCPDRLAFDEIIFVKRKPYSSDHYYTDINNGTHADRFHRDNGIYVYNIRTGRERAVVTASQLPGQTGFIGKISLSFDAEKVVFDFRENPGSGFRIWEVNVDGSGLRQVTHSPDDEAEKVKRWGRPWHTDDIHPCYLPDGNIIFSSTRCEHTILCGGSAALVAPVLHRMDAHGGNIEQLSFSPVSEFCPVVLDDGRVMYHRWEYIDKGARVCKTIWSMNPDGSRPQELYGVGDDTTTVYMYPQAIPGSNGSRLVTVGTCHFPQGGCLGAVMYLDLQREIRRRGPDPDEPGFKKIDPQYVANNLTPEVFVERRTEPGWYFRVENGKYVHDREGMSGHLYTHPYPISEDEFLVSYKADAGDHYKNVPNAYGIYLLDTGGGLRAVHRDAALSCWHAMVLKAREVPPVIRSSRDPEYAARGEALCVVRDVYEGMEGIERGEIKWLRINEAIPRYWDTGRRWGHATSSSSWKAALWPRVQWGVVPVEPDGSACFTVPTNRDVFYQALDKDFREVQRERTYVNYKPGEVRSCVGCHGRNNYTGAAAGHKATALSRPPSVPQPQPCDLVENGGDGRARQVIHYPTDIQPIFDAKCVSCHGNENPAAGLRLTSNVTQYYNVSYEELCRKQLAGPIIPEFTSFTQGDQGNYNGATLPPKSLGSYNSVLMAVLTDAEHMNNKTEDHSQMLDANELMVLSRWVDSNYQFYGTYYGRHHSHWATVDPGDGSYSPKDFRRRPTFEEAISNRAPKWHR